MGELNPLIECFEIFPTASDDIMLTFDQVPKQLEEN